MSTVLLVDDEPSMSQLVEYCLEDLGARVVQSQNLPDALVEARRSRPDVILLDLSLGDRDGLEILPHLQDDSYLKDVPVVAFSVHDSRRAELVGNQVEAFIAKPFKAHELRDGIRPFLTGRVARGG